MLVRAERNASAVSAAFDGPFFQWGGPDNEVPTQSGLIKITLGLSRTFPLLCVISPLWLLRT